MPSPTPIKRNAGRPTKIEEAIAIFVEAYSQSIKQQQESLGLVASGRSINSHEIVINKNQVLLTAADYYSFLTTGTGLGKAGRSPGKFPPSDAIEGWIKDKGIAGDGVSINDLVFLISRKIGDKGTAIWEGKQQPISLDKAFQDAKFEDLLEAVGTEQAVDIDKLLEEAFGKQIKDKK